MKPVEDIVQKIRWRLRGRRYLSFRDVESMAQSIWETGKEPRRLKMAPDVVLEWGEWSTFARFPSAFGILDVHRDPRLRSESAEVR